MRRTQATGFARLALGVLLAIFWAGCGGSSDSDFTGATNNSSGRFFGGSANGDGSGTFGGFHGGPSGVVPPGTGSPVIFNPGGTGGDVAALNQQGLAALQRGEFVDYVEARNLFGQAVALIGSATPATDSDTAHFFFALTRVAAVASELPSDGQSSDFNTVADFLDSLGFAATPRVRYQGFVAPGTFTGNVSGDTARAFLLGRVRAEFEGAIADLDAVSQTFSIVWQRKQNGPGLQASTSVLTVESDFGDVLSFRSTFEMGLGSILVVSSYDLGNDVAPVLNDVNRTVQGILSGNPAALTLADSSLLAQAQARFNSGITDAIAATQAIRAETDPQNDDLITLVATPTLTIDDFLAQAEIWRNALTNTVGVRSSGNASTASLSLQNFFSGAAGANLRPQLPPFTGDHVTGHFPGTPFTNVYNSYVSGSQSDPNRDINTNGVPDTLE